MLSFIELIENPINLDIDHSNVFSIHDLEKLTGIKSHTLRIWEKRYHILNPARKSNNFRTYTIDELERILNISLLNKSGLKISILSIMEKSEIEQRINKLTSDCDKKERAINSLIISMHRLNNEDFEMVLNICCLTWTLDILIREIIFTFLKRIDLLWIGSQLTSEHFIITAIRKKLIMGIEKAEVKLQRNNQALLFLPDSSQLDLMLLYTHYLLKREGWQVFYMGYDVSILNITSVLNSKKPSHVFTYLTHKHNFNIGELSCIMNKVLPDSKLIIGTSIETEVVQENSNTQLMGFEKAIECLIPDIDNELLESKRLQSLNNYDVLDTSEETIYDNITKLASIIFNVPISIISFVDKDRIWFKSHYGLSETQIDRDPGLCSSAILSDEVYVVEDAVLDKRAFKNPLVTGSFGLRFYAAVPLQTRDKFNLGTICIIDIKPRMFSDKEKEILKQLGTIVMNEMDSRFLEKNQDN